jgi:peptidyl-prolyl cis-trans isomerase D
MLQAIREKVTGWIAYGIIFLISIPFALWGVNSYLGGGEVAPAATVNGQEITAAELDQAYGRYRQRLSRLFGGSIPESFGTESMLREQVRNQLIEETALRQYIEEQRYRISDADLNRMIRAMEVFQRDGRFESQIYEAQLRSLGYSPLGFEQEMRTNGAVQQFQAGLQETAFTVPVMQKRFSSLRNQTRKLRTLRYRVDASNIEISNDEIERHYLAQSDRYMTPEQVKIDYIELGIDTVKQGIDVPEADVVARYEANRAAYTSPETRTASHILITAKNDAESEQALSRIADIRERIEGGESFAEMAREFSEDPVSAAEGGNLGEIEKGVMVPSFESELYSMEVGELSEPVKTNFGWHLIKLHSIEGGETQSFESLRADLEDEIKTELAESQVYDLVESLANLAYEQPDSLSPAAEQLGLELETSDWFDRFSGQGIAADPKVRQQAFSDEVLRQGLNSEGIELNDNRIVFIRLNQHREAQQQALEEVREAVLEDLRRSRMRELATTAGNEGLAALENGESLDDLAQRWDAEIDDHGFVARDQADVDAAVRGRAFRMPRPDQGVVFDGLSVASGEYVIIELSAILSNDANLDQEALEGLTTAAAEAEYRATVNLLSSRAEVTRTPLEDL